MNIDVVVLGGGLSDEREVSLRSAKAVARAAREAGFIVLEVDPAQGLEPLDGMKKSTIVFPILHGSGGEDGTIQAELEKRGLPYLGSDGKASARCFDKWITQKSLERADINVAKNALVTQTEYPTHELSKKPHVLKILHGGSSIGTLMIRDPSTVDQVSVNEIFKNDKQVLLEELVQGIEITVPILDKSALPVIEIKPPESGEFDYENKYNGATQEICPPTSISKEVQNSAKILAENVHKTMNCRHLSRVDIIVRPNNSLVILEINTIPGMTSQSLYPKSAAVTGINMPRLIQRFVEMVKRDFNTG
jgi:D-alanine-D-alanine ligase